MIDYTTAADTIARETDVEKLRELVTELLHDVDRKRKIFAKHDPITEPAFRSDPTRSVLPRTTDLEVMRTLAKEAFQGINAIDVQIARAPKP